MNHNKGQGFMRFVAVIAGTLALAACGGAGGSGDQSEGLAEAPEGAADAASGVYGGLVYGNPDAKVTIIEYGSLTCGACANFATNILPEIKEKYIDTGIAKLVYRDYQRNRIDLIAGLVARCKTDEFAKRAHDTFFKTQGDWLRAQDQVSGIASVARRLGMSRVEFDRCVNDKALAEHLSAVTDHASEELMINATPTIYVNGRLLESNTISELRENLAGMIEKAAE